MSASARRPSLVDRVVGHSLLRRYGRRLLIGVPFTWLLLFFLLPFAIILKISVSQVDEISYRSLVTYQDGVVNVALDLGQYFAITQDQLYVIAYIDSIKYAAATTLACLVIGYPFAYFMARARPGRQPALLMLVMLPFWTSFLLRVYAWKGLLLEGGWVARVILGLHLDRVLVALGLIAEEGRLMNTPFSLALGMTYTYLPFMILPLYGTLAKLDQRLLEAAANLGATPWVAFWKVTVPLSRAGIIAGSMLVFIPCIGEYVIPELLGGPDTMLIGRVLWDEYFANMDWPMASSVAAVVILLVVVPVGIFNRSQAEVREVKA
ncbi:MAG: ABC transporter permease subunit [Anaeromyxobacter sp.]